MIFKRPLTLWSIQFCWRDCLRWASCNGKLWRLLKNWYEGVSCYVRIDGKSSEKFRVEKGVRQGSVLSPSLFLLVMDPLLRQLESSGLGLSINNYYIGGFLHADDIRTLATSAESLQQQVDLVKNFAAKHFLKPNIEKCEVVVFTRSHQEDEPVCEIEGTFPPVSDAGKCLGVWWKGNLMATKSIEENIKKARRAFFLLGSLGTFQSNLGPLSNRSVVETCVLPVLMYGCENWILG